MRQVARRKSYGGIARHFCRSTRTIVAIVAALSAVGYAGTAFAQDWQGLIEGVVRGMATGTPRQQPQPTENVVPLGQQPAQAPSVAQSCSQTAGPERAQELARQCLQVSEATRPPCNAENPCDMMVNEIRRSCALKQGAGIAVPQVCNEPIAGLTTSPPEDDPRGEVREIQRHLTMLGYEPGPVDGVFGDETRRALERFQRVANLPATGEASASTLSALRDAAQGKGTPAHQTIMQGDTAPSGGVPATRQIANSGTNGIRAIAPVMLEGRLLTGYPLAYGRFNKEQVQRDARRRHYTKSSFDLALYMDLFILKHWPDVLKRQDYAYEYAHRFLTGSSLARYVSDCRGNCGGNGPFGGWAGQNEFEREASYQAFVKDLPGLLGPLAPDAPVEAILVREVRIQPYGSSAGAFPMALARPGLTVYGTVPPAARVSAEPDFKVPSQIKVPRAEAPEFLEPLQAQKRKAYLGLYVSLGKPDWDPNLSAVKTSMTLTGAKLYLDPDLQRQIHDFDVGPAVATTSEVAPGPAPDRLPVLRSSQDSRLAGLPDDHESIARALLLARWRADPAMTSDENVLLQLAHYLLPEPDRAALLARRRWAGVDEFAQGRSRQRFLTEWRPRLLAQAPQLPFRFSVVSLAGLGAYDPAGEKFPVPPIELSQNRRERRTIYLPTSNGLANHRITVDRDPPSALPLSTSDAEALLKRQRNAIANELKRTPQYRHASLVQSQRFVVFRAEIEVDEAASTTSTTSRQSGYFTWTGRIRRMDLFEDLTFGRKLLDNDAILSIDPARALEARRDGQLTVPAELLLGDRWNGDDTSLLIAARTAPERLTPEIWRQAAESALSSERSSEHSGDRSMRFPWGRFFPDGFASGSSRGLMPEHVEAFRVWTLRRAAAMPSILWIPIHLNGTSHRAGTPMRRLEFRGNGDRTDDHALQSIKLAAEPTQSIIFRLPDQRGRYRVELPSNEFDALGGSYRAWLRARVTEYGSGPHGPILVVEPERVSLVRSAASLPKSEPRIERPVLFGDTLEEARTKVAAATTASQAAQAAEAAKKLTILGMAPGMALTEARRMASAHLGADARFYVPELNGMETPASRLFDASILMEKADGTERISLFASRRQHEPIVVAIRRQLVLAKGIGPTDEEVLAQATGQYGKPNGTVQSATWSASVARGAASPDRCVATRLHATSDQFIWRRERTPRFFEPRYLMSRYVTGANLQSNACGVNLRMENKSDVNAAPGTRVLTFESEDLGLAVGLLSLPVPQVAEKRAPLGFASIDARTPHDVLQMYPGMPLAEAEPLAKSHLPDAIRLVADGTNPVAPTKHTQLASGVLLADPARKESITLFTERDGTIPTVVAVMRHVIVPKDNAVMAAITADAIKKYGDPGARTEHGLYWGVKPRATDSYFSPCIYVSFVGVGRWRNGSPWQAAPGAPVTLEGPIIEFLGTVPVMRVDSLGPGDADQHGYNSIRCPAQAGLTFIPASADTVIVGQWTIDTGGTAELLDRIRAGTASPGADLPQTNPRPSSSEPKAAPKIKL